MKEYYVYELIDPRNNKPFYIGKGKYKRMYAHFNAIKNNKNLINKHLENKLKKLLCDGLKPNYKKIFESDNEKLCFNKEIERIKEIGRENLCNLTDGGEGGSVYGRKLSLETKNKIRNSNIGKKRSEETKENIRISRIKQYKDKRNHPMFGKKHSMKSKKKMSESKMGEKNHNYGKHLSEEHKYKISQSNIGRKMLPEQIEKMRLTKIGSKHRGSGKKAWETRRKNNNHIFTEEHRKNLSIAAKIGKETK